MTKLLIILIRFYQCTLSRVFGRCCRFYPTCSEYAIEALRTRGFFVGTWLALKRIARCHPFHPGGVDPVPAVEKRISG